VLIADIHDESNDKQKKYNCISMKLTVVEKAGLTKK
jgi:hypothetical protein